MRFNVVVTYNKYDSVIPESLIQSDHKTKLMMKKESKVSMARKNLAFQR